MLEADADLKLQQANASARATGTATIKPYDPTPLVGAKVALQGVDLAALGPDLPHTRLDAEIDLQSLDAGFVRIINREPGLYDQGRVPVRSLSARVDRSGGGFRFDQVVAALGGAQPAGDISGKGSYRDSAVTLDVATRELDLRKLDSRMRATRLAGTATITHRDAKQEFTVALSEPVQRKRLSLAAHAVFANALLAVDRAELKLGGSAIDLSGRVAFDGAHAFSAQGRIRQFRLRELVMLCREDDPPNVTKLAGLESSPEGIAGAWVLDGPQLQKLDDWK